MYTHFYMTLPTLQGPNIPGEPRIPLAALDLDHAFWGWPHNYTRQQDPRGGQGRIYFEWHPQWTIIDASTNQQIIQTVRMYMYENSADFRFYARPLVSAGADLGDIVKISPINAGYECILAKQGTTLHTQWLSFCTIPVVQSTRRFGYQ